MKSIWAHTLVRNEERFVWFAVMSVIEYVEKILIWDTGSNDKTVKIIKEIKRKYPKKVNFKEVGEVTPKRFTQVRQEMLEATLSDWFIVVDGDEIWWEDSIRKIVEVIKKKGDKIESIVVPVYNLVGDIYHYQEKAAGKYQLAGKRGHLSLRAVNRKIPGLRADKPHGTFGWIDNQGRMIQDRNIGKIEYINSAPILHATYLPRSSERRYDLDVPKRAKKLKYEVGKSFSLDFYYPEVLFRPKPNFVLSPWRRMSRGYLVRAVLETPLRKLKRRILKDGKPGY